MKLSKFNLFAINKLFLFVKTKNFMKYIRKEMSELLLIIPRRTVLEHSKENV